MTPNRLPWGRAIPIQLGSPVSLFNSLLRAIGLLITVALLLLGPARADDPVGNQQSLEVVGARVTTTPERARLILDLTHTTKFAIVSLAGPNRIAVDVQATGLKFSTAPPPAGSGLVSAYTVA